MKADILFLIDSSASIESANFKKIKEFMESFVRQADIGPNNVQIGLIQFSSETKEEFPLNRYTQKDDLQAAISGIQQMQQGTMTGAALQDALPYFSRAKGGRPDIKQYLIIITDGESQDEVAEPAAAIRKYGVDIYAIGVLNANNTQLLEIAGQQDQVYFEDSFDTLQFLNKMIIFEICNPKDCELDSFILTFLLIKLLTEICSNQIIESVKSLNKYIYIVYKEDISKGASMSVQACGVIIYWQRLVPGFGGGHKHTVSFMIGHF